jgi:hypothetical protein
MSQSTSTTSREITAEVAARLRKILSAPEGGDVLDQLARAGLVTRHDGLPVQDVIAAMPGRDLTAVMRDDAVAPAAGAIGRVDPRKSRATLTGGRTLGMYVQDCLISTEASPAYHRLPSFSQYSPYHIVYLLGFGPNQTHTVNITIQVYSTGGSVRITTTGNSTAMVLGQSSVPLTIPVTLKTTAQGFASILIQRVGATGFDWFAADVF